MTLGQRIQELRKQNGMSQEGLGERLGVSRQAVSKWEGDNGIPELDTLIAMSRIFGITVGQLLGVEDAAPPEEEDKSPREEKSDEERLEAILSKYAKEMAAEKKDVPWFKRWGLDLSAAIVAVVIIIVLFSQISSLRSSVRMLNNDVARLQVQVNNQQSNLNGQIRDTIYAVLTEEAKLLNTFAWEVESFNLHHGTVTLRINASLKEYRAGSQLQFAAQWRTEDGKTGKADSDWSEGPEFSVLMTLPMNYVTELSVRIKNADTIKEQFVETLHTLDEDNFKLYAYNLTVPFAITTRSFGVERSTARAEQAFVDIMSAYPNKFYPTKAHILAYINDEEVFAEDMTITQSEDDTQSFCASIKDNYFEVIMKEGDAFRVVLDVTDNLGRSEQFVESGKVVDGWLEREALAVPADMGK